MQASQPTLAATLKADRQLADAALAGETGAFEQLVRQYQKLCWHVVQRMVRHPEDTRELCQEVFLRVHQSLHQYRGDSALKSWIAQIAYSIAKRHLERKRIPLIEGAELQEILRAEPNSPVAESDPAILKSDLEINARLHAAIELLPPLQRTLLTLYHLEELSINEIALITRLSAGTIKSHLFRSRKQLYQRLESELTSTPRKAPELRINHEVSPEFSLEENPDEPR
jgi:RNA polymerase sigma factor (sigma-70 family)